MEYIENILAKMFDKSEEKFLKQSSKSDGMFFLRSSVTFARLHEYLSDLGARVRLDDPFSAV